MTLVSYPDLTDLPLHTGVKVYQPTSFSVPNATDTIVTYSTAAYDNGGFWNAGSPTRLTVPVGKNGKYLISAHAVFAPSGTGNRQLWIRRNGSFYVTQPLHVGTATNSTALMAVGVLDTNSGDYFECGAWQSSGAALNVTGNGESNIWFSLTYLGPSATTDVTPTAPSFTGARAYPSAAVTLTTGVDVPIPLNTETFDTDGFHDNTTNNTRMTIPAGKGGYYFVRGQVSFVTNATGRREVQVRKNGSVVFGDVMVAGQSGNQTMIEASGVVATVPGDYIELVGNQTSGGNLDISGNDNNSSLSVTYLGPTSTSSPGDGFAKLATANTFTEDQTIGSGDHLLLGDAGSLSQPAATDSIIWSYNSRWNGTNWIRRIADNDASRIELLWNGDLVFWTNTDALATVGSTITWGEKFRITKAGQVQFPVATAASTALVIGADTNLYRTAADILATDDSFQIGTGTIWMNAARDRAIFIGAGSPEGVNTGSVGSMKLRTDGAAGTVLYVKNSGTGNTGWAPLT